MLSQCRAYILAKDEEANISRCLKPLVALGIDVVVLDSGSADRTKDIARAMGATVEAYRYTTHADAINEITTVRTAGGQWVMVLDADFVLSSDLLAEIGEFMKSGACDVVFAPIRMHWSGVPVRHASLCPAKAFLFRGGAAYLEEIGHGEKVREGIAVATAKHAIDHDDRKPFRASLESQSRYASQLLDRAAKGKLTARDRIRMSAPWMIFVTPFVSFVLRLGFLDGRAGLGYAVDRVIAEGIMYRAGLAARIGRNVDPADVTRPAS